MPHPSKEHPVRDVIRVLSTAREMLAPQGNWLKNAYDEKGRWCVIGAIMEAAGRCGFRDVVKHQVNAQCGRRIACTLETLYGSGLYVTEWQDTPERKQKEVLQLMDKSIVDEQKILLEEDQQEIEALQDQLKAFQDQLSVIKDTVYAAYEEGWIDSSNMTGMTMAQAWKDSLSYSRLNPAP